MRAGWLCRALPIDGAIIGRELRNVPPTGDRGFESGFLQGRVRCEPEASSSSLQTNSMMAATKHRILEMMFSAIGSGSVGKANPNAAQMANTTNGRSAGR